ncbi:MAG: T9SS type A sorting domain-containing protein, partial [Saprospiraceae bacterium]|nr:T9SS type A sorting domain-containing protein [Saprospiraceae bacterium]
AYAIDQTPDGGLIIGGNTWSTDGDVTGSEVMGPPDFWIVKLGHESVAAETPETENLEIYPSPVNDVLSLKLPQAPMQVRVYDLSGKQVGIVQPRPDGRLDVSHLSAGFYFLEAWSEDGRRLIGRFQKH